MNEDGDKARLDIWLWRARFFKTRALAQDFIQAKGVRLERGGLCVRKIDKPAYALAPGDRLAFAIQGRAVHIVVRALGVRRGPASEAELLYSTLLG